MAFIIASFFCLVMTSCVSSRNVVEMEADQSEYQNSVIQEVLKELTKPGSQENKIEANGFSWSNCGSPSDWVNVTKLSLAPDPLEFPTTLTVAGIINVTHSLTAELTLKLLVKRKFLSTFIEIPCIDNVGSCEYNNVCEMLGEVQCPQQLIDIGINCKCPITKKLYTLDSASFQVGSVPIPSGEYEIQATLKKGDIEAACLKLYFQIKE